MNVGVSPGGGSLDCSPEPALGFRSLNFRRGRRRVLRDLTWAVPSEGRTLLLGENGAGKTTTFRLASGALPLRSGVASWRDRPVSSAGLRAHVALMPQDIRAIPGLNVGEQVAFAAWLGGRSESDARAAAGEALKQVGLAGMVKRRPGQLSGGELRRVGLAEALARPAKLLLLDEPTAGLDPTQRARFRELLMGIDRPVVVSTHQLDDVDSLYDSVAVLHGGRMVFSGPMQDFLDYGRAAEPGRRAELAFMRITGSA